MASLDQFINPDLSTNDVLHSSGYVDALGNGSGAGGLSMEKRRQLLNQPRTVGTYGQSQLGRRYGAVKARAADQKVGRVYDASSDSFSDGTKTSNRQVGGIKDKANIDSSVRRRQHFVEPSQRPKPSGHNPYA
ncbi:MAG: hypothetical protein WAS27_01970 [Candidatus Saccharimonadales bacterium]